MDGNSSRGIPIRRIVLNKYNLFCGKGVRHEPLKNNINRQPICSSTFYHTSTLTFFSPTLLHDWSTIPLATPMTWCTHPLASGSGTIHKISGPDKHVDKYWFMEIGQSAKEREERDQEPKTVFFTVNDSPWRRYTSPQGKLVGHGFGGWWCGHLAPPDFK